MPFIMNFVSINELRIEMLGTCGLSDTCGEGHVMRLTVRYTENMSQVLQCK